MPRPLRFSAFVMNTTSHITHGAWRLPDAQQHEFDSLQHWVSLAQELERGKFDFVFFADVVGLYADHRSSWRKFIESGLQIPSNDPSVIASALAAATSELGIAVTSSILQEHPFNWARKASTLDHATRGRIAWNIVTSLSPNAWRNFGHDDIVPHDQRYALRTRSGRVVGTPEQIADSLAEWRDAGVDGINVTNYTIPGSYREFIEHVTPVLQERGLQQREYAPGTLRRKITGEDLLDDRHPAAAYRGAFS